MVSGSIIFQIFVKLALLLCWLLGKLPELFQYNVLPIMFVSPKLFSQWYAEVIKQKKNQ